MEKIQDKNIDIAVHALKDLPAIETDGLMTDTFLERNDPKEILISKDKNILKKTKNEITNQLKSISRSSIAKKSLMMRKKFQDHLIGLDGDWYLKKLSFGVMEIIEFMRD